MSRSQRSKQKWQPKADLDETRLVIEALGREAKAAGDGPWDVIQALQEHCGYGEHVRVDGWTEEGIAAFVAIQMAALPHRRPISEISAPDMVGVLRKAWKITKGP